jgi:hypothetical protein
MSRLPLPSFAFAVALGAAAPAGATIVNGSFEQGLDGWSGTDLAGVVGTVTGDPGAPPVFPTDGFWQAAMTPREDAGIGIEEIEFVFDLDAGFPNPFPVGSQGGITEGNGAAILQRFAVNAGDTISFDWTFFNSENPGSGYNDVAFAALAIDDGPVTVIPLADSFETYVALQSPGFGGFDYTFFNLNSFSDYTGPQSSSIAVPETGTAALLFAAFNQGDASVSPGLLIDNVVLQPVDVSSPSLAGLFGFAAVGLALARRRRRLLA